ncbi:CDC27 family protein [Belliella sp. DSM 111904]|uniref:CDC27 family protein n=1 Tax=Belliella filtrata TaxID=2923435 RepID=A0ABS9V129_9BACT|nr:CDC27 family protein [Belliella filtrata]MCH7410118.1 CDC27 family protein [Belliella filtrata]
MHKFENPISLGNHHLRQALKDIIETDFTIGYEQLLKAYANTSIDQDIVRDHVLLNLLTKVEQVMIDSYPINKPSYRSSRLIGTVYFLLQKYNSAIQFLKPCLRHDDSSIAHNLCAKSLWHLKEFHKSLMMADKALSLVENSRNFLLKTTILNPYLEENTNNDLVSKSFYLEYNIAALNLSATNQEAYEAILAFTTREGIKVDLPSIYNIQERSP